MTIVGNIREILGHKSGSTWTIAPESTVFEAIQLMAEKNIGALLVVKDHKLEGIISERDIVRAIAEEGAAALALTVGERMTKDVATCEENDTIAEIMETMTRCRFRHMPVVESGRIAGIVSIGDVVKIRIAETLREAQALKDYIAAG